MRFAITGGTGFIGRTLGRHLEAAGHEVVPISRRTGVGLDDVDALTAAFEGCAGVAHCAGINRETGAQRYAEVHVRGTENVVEAARRAGVGRLALTSFLRARPDCGSPYHESKWAAEEIVRGSGIDFTIIKPGVVYGSGDHLLDHLSHGLSTFPVFALVGMKETRVRPLAVDDLARVLSASLTDTRLSGKTLAVTGPEELTFEDVSRRVGEVIGKHRFYFRMPLAFHYSLAWFLERIMKIPMISLAQVRILSESMVDPVGDLDDLPVDLTPRTAFDEAVIRRGLPAPGRFGLRDLELTPCPR